ncbi:MAG: hypothetical protein M3P18_09790 [Actinomycetota bacterium]|nr:hypothetical protein [Actinomycetota bacterium]
MTTTPTQTAAERVEVTLHRLGYLIGRHHLPEPVELQVRALSVRVDCKNLHDLKRWAQATDATMTDSGLQLVACTLLGDVPLRMTCFGEALTP